MIGVELRTSGRLSSNLEDSFAYVSYSSKDSWIAGQMNLLRILPVTWTYSQVHACLRARASLGVNIRGYGCVDVCMCVLVCMRVIPLMCNTSDALCVALIQINWTATSVHVRTAAHVRRWTLGTRVNVIAHSSAMTVNVGIHLPLNCSNLLCWYTIYIMYLFIQL